jgi:hypothetical protein
MIPTEHRLKGGALVIGAEVHGEPGPFGTWTDEDDQEPGYVREDPSEPMPERQPRAAADR